MKQSKMLISDGKILYSVVKEAIEEAGFSLQSKNQKSVLVWYDNLREADFYSTLKPWQVVNRIPFVNLICRKAPFIQLMNRMKIFFPTLYTFYPESLILPSCNNEFQKLVSNHDKNYIVKPDNGSLGYGITILSKNSIFKPIKNLCIAQEYIDSYLISDTKFDLRVYALISSVVPLKIYVYHDGIARFCSEKSTVNNIFSQLTNTAVNRNNPNVKIESITKTISEVFQILEQKGKDTNLLWSKIENAVILSILPVFSYIKSGVTQKNLSKWYNRCFQILGFDFILDANLDPFVLEVNYRPSLDADTEAERQLKTKMLGTAMHIGAPLELLQKLILENNEISNFSNEKWDLFFKKANERFLLIDQNVNTGLFHLVYPSNNADNAKTYNEVLNIVNRCPTKLTPHFKLPVLLKKPDPSLLPKVNPIIFYSNNLEIDDLHKKIETDTNQKEQKLCEKNDIKINSIQSDQQKNMAKMKQKKLNEASNKSKQLLSSPDKIKIFTNSYIRRIIEEIESMKEFNSTEPKVITQKNMTQKKSVVSPNPHSLPTSINSQNSNNNIKIANSQSENAESDVITQPMNSLEKPPEAKPTLTLNSNLKQRETENINKKTKDDKVKQIPTNVTTFQNNVYSKVNRTRRSASTKPITRTIAPTEQAKIDHINKNYHNIEDFSKKYFDIITNKLKQDMDQIHDLNTKLPKSTKSNKPNNNYKVAKAPVETPLVSGQELNKPQTSTPAVAMVNKQKVATKQSLYDINDKTRNNDSLKMVNRSANHSEAEKQTRRNLQIYCSVKPNPNQDKSENAKTNMNTNMEKENISTTRIVEAKSKSTKIEKNEARKINDDSQLDLKLSQEQTTETKLKPKSKIILKSGTDAKPKNKPKCKTIEQKTASESKVKTNNTPENISKANKNNIEPISKVESQTKAIKNESQTEITPKQQENKIVKTAPLDIKEKSMKMDPKPKMEIDNEKVIKTEPKSKKEFVQSNKIEIDTKNKNAKTEIKNKLEIDKSSKTDSETKNKAIVGKDQKLLKDGYKSKQETSLASMQEFEVRDEIIKEILKNRASKAKTLK